MRNILVISLIAFLGMQTNPLQPPQFIGGGINTTANGVVRIDSYMCYGTQPIVGNTGGQVATKTCPIRVEFGEDVSSDVLICRSTKEGQICSTLGKLISVR